MEEKRNGTKKRAIDLKAQLELLVDQFNRPDFITHDPISIPHQYTQPADIEIVAFWSAMLAWGQRVTIINKSLELFALMDNAPHDFIVNHEERDRQRFERWRHRTFQYTDTLYFLSFLQWYYRQHDSLEQAFAKFLDAKSPHVGPALIGFHRLFFSLEFAPQRTRKHIATPERKSTCKRLNMFLRWMVRQDDKGIDFGLWRQIRPSQLLLPLDVHVDRIARRMGLIQRKQTDWFTVLELTERLQQFHAADPARYDFALFGLGVLEKQQPDHPLLAGTLNRSAAD